MIYIPPADLIKGSSFSCPIQYIAPKRYPRSNWDGLRSNLLRCYLSLYFAHKPRALLITLLNYSSGIKGIFRLWPTTVGIDHEILSFRAYIVPRVPLPVARKRLPLLQYILGFSISCLFGVTNAHTSFRLQYEIAGSGTRGTTVIHRIRAMIPLIVEFYMPVVKPSLRGRAAKKTFYFLFYRGSMIEDKSGNF